jgi:UDP-N-acetyl-D-mannosaminuronic acid dehydrogenase
MRVSVVGAAGHVGLGMCLVLADAGHNVVGVDTDVEKNALVNSGNMPHFEEDGEELLSEVLDAGRMKITDDLSSIADSNVVIVIIGTPLDENLNPNMSPLRELFKDMMPFLRTGQIVMLRSTVSPGTTDLMKNFIESNGLVVGDDITLLFAPERVAQGKAIEELKSLPQLVGAYDTASYERGREFFDTFIEPECKRLTPLEAEVGKLITNMTRYVSFALANEYHLIASTFGVNINSIIDACNDGYPRLDMPGPGPNVGGPCLYKDGWLLVDRVPYNELISSAFRINEGMPMQIIQQMRSLIPEDRLRRVAILGMTFKANSDDLRNSLSLKLRNQLDARGIEVVAIEPNAKGFDEISSLAGVDAAVLMTPHKEFKNLSDISGRIENPECLFVDIWGFWEEMKYTSKNGYFFSSEISSQPVGR